MTSSPYATAPAAPARQPATDSTSASHQNSRRTAAAGYPAAFRRPTSRSRCSIPSRKNRLASSSADTTRKKLK